MASASKKTSLNKGFFMSSSFYSKPQGNMAEYILPVVLVGLVAVSGLAWMFQGDNGQNIILKTAQGDRLSVNQTGQATLVSKQYGKNPNERPLMITLANGQTIQLDNVPVNLSVAVEVDGPNGTTSQILAALEQLIAQLEVNGENPDTLSALRALATSGYGLANKQRIIENKAMRCGTDKLCMNENGRADDSARQASFSMVLNACASDINSFCDRENLFQTYGLTPLKSSDWRLIRTLHPGFEERVLSSGQFNYTRENVLVGPSIAQFIRAFGEVNQNPSLSPQVNTLVSNMAQQIFTIARLSSNGFSEVGIGSNYTDLKSGQTNPLGSNLDSTPNEYAQVVAGKMVKQDIPSLFSHQTSGRSDVICATGQGRNENGQCQ
jgi:hypothetical protein